jgi:hypothetical protein
MYAGKVGAYPSKDSYQSYTLRKAPTSNKKSLLYSVPVLVTNTSKSFIVNTPRLHESRKSHSKGRLSTVDLLIKITFCKKGKVF